MERIHLFELEDQAWFPRIIRDYGTDCMRFMSERAGVARVIAGKLKPVLAGTGDTEMLDLCSGGGGPAVAVAEQLKRDGHPVKVTLTDLYPNFGAFERARAGSGGMVDFVQGSVDASSVPEELAGLRTLFNAFHHFRPEQARGILEDAVRQRRAIAVCEVPQRTVLGVLLALLLSPLLVLLATPFIRPFRWSRIIFTYLIPAVLLLIWWDGLVSALRAYSPRELKELTAGLDPGGYVWEAGRGPLPRPITYLIGYPVSP